MKLPTLAAAKAASRRASSKRAVEADNWMVQIDGKEVTKREIMEKSGVSRHRLNALIRTKRLTWAALGVVCP